MKKKSFFSFFVLLIPAVFFARADYWTQLSDFPGPVRQVPSSFVIGSRGYVCCGYDGSDLNDLWAFNAITNQWTQCASLPAGGRNGAVSFAIGNKGYIGLGSREVNDFWEYDPVPNSWTRKADFPGTARGFAASFAIGDKGYVGLGGNNGTLADIWEYDPLADSWLQKNNFPGNSRGYMTAFVIDGKAYVNTGLSGTSYFNDNWEYNPVADAWTQMADLPAPGRADAAAFSICDKGFLGTGGEAPFFHDFWEFDPVTNQWMQRADLPGGGRDDCAYFSIGTKGYVGLGQLMGITYATDFWEYTPNESCVLPPVADFDAMSSICPGTCTSVYNFSINAASYEWNFPGASVTTSNSFEPAALCYNVPGVYDITLIATNSAGSDTLTIHNCITVFPYTLPQSIVHSGDSLISEAGFANYQWYHNGLMISGATENIYVVADSGDYNVIATDSNGCEVEAVIYDVHIDVREIDAAENIFFYPNPAGDRLYIKGIVKASVLLVNTLGEEVSPEITEQELRGDEIMIDISSLPPGIYFVRTRSPVKKKGVTFLKE